MVPNIVAVSASQGEVFDVADPARHGKIIKTGPEVSEVRFDDGAERLAPMRKAPVRLPVSPRLFVSCPPTKRTRNTDDRSYRQ